jgi:hypothetical protein
MPSARPSRYDGSVRYAWALIVVAACGNPSAPLDAPGSPDATHLDGASDVGTGASDARDSTLDASDDAPNVPDGSTDASSDATDSGSQPDTLADAPAACALASRGSFVTLVGAITSAERTSSPPGSNALVVPSATTRDAFAALVVRVLDGDDAAACSLTAPYRLLLLDDPRAGALRVVAELDATATPVPSLFYGTYAAPQRASARATQLIIEAPHPIFDTNTEIESADLFVQYGAAAFLLAGTHRCTDTAASPCSGTTTACGTSAPFRISDAAHANALPFSAIHAAYSTAVPGALFLQLHGNSDACPTALMSDASGTWSGVGSTATLAAALQTRGVAIGECGMGYPTTSCNLCGTDNVEARFTAGATDACTMRGASYGRFIHVEQQPSLRATPTASAPGYQTFIDAVLAAFP